MAAWPGGAADDLGLLAPVVIAGGTGVLAHGIGVPGPSRWIAAVHGAAGLGLLLLVPWRSAVVGRASRRPLPERAPTAAVALGVTVVLTGVLHAVVGAAALPAAVTDAVKG